VISKEKNKLQSATIKIISFIIVLFLGFFIILPCFVLAQDSGETPEIQELEIEGKGIELTLNNIKADILSLIKQKVLVIYEKIEILEQEGKNDPRVGEGFWIKIVKIKLDLERMKTQGFSQINGKILEFRSKNGMASTSTEASRTSTSTIITATSTVATATSTSATTTEAIEETEEDSSAEVVSGGGGRGGPVAPIADEIAPAVVSNLSASNPTITSIDITWTSPGDSDSSGTASSYDVRYSTSVITSSNWSSATQVAGEPIPLAAGSIQSMTISSLTYGTKYYFAIKTSDEVSNESDISNVINKTTNEPEECSTNVASGAQTYFVRSDAEPGILQVDINPLDVSIGLDQTVIVRMRDANGLEVTSVVGTIYSDNGSQSFDLSLDSGDAIRGYWKGTWSPVDTLCTIYMMKIEATGGSVTSNIELSFR